MQVNLTEIELAVLKVMLKSGRRSYWAEEHIYSQTRMSIYPAYTQAQVKAALEALTRLDFIQPHLSWKGWYFVNNFLLFEKWYKMQKDNFKPLIRIQCTTPCCSKVLFDNYSWKSPI